MEGREPLELLKQSADKKFTEQKDAVIAKMEDLLGRVRKADTRWVSAFYTRLRNETLDALENLGRAAEIVDIADTALKQYDETHKKPQNPLAFGGDIWAQ